MNIQNKIPNPPPNCKLIDNPIMSHSLIHSNFYGLSNIAFSSLKKNIAPSLTNAQKLFLKMQRPLAYMVGDVNAAKNYNLSKLEGIQNGISVFDGLSLKEISFIGDNLIAICATQGCYSKCSHCYADAHKPIKENDDYINSMAFEDFASLLNGFKELQRRTGLEFIGINQKSEYISFVYDADDMSVVLKDKDGNQHEFPELNKLLYTTTGKKSIFDTSGWNIKSKKMQERADRLLEYYAKDEHIGELYQFNVSINTFHSIYQKSLELRKNGYEQKAKDLYNIYVERMANALLVFSSIIDKPNFGVIARAVEYDNRDIDETALSRILIDIEQLFKDKCIQDFNTQKKYVKTRERLVDLLKNVALDYKIIDTDILLGKRFAETMNKFPVQNSKYNIHIPYSEKLDLAEHYYNLLKKTKSFKSSHKMYCKIIDITGKVYLTDNYRVIPTDIQLNFINKNKKADAFHSQVTDFIFTKDMI